MMHTRCQYCQQIINLSLADTATAVAIAIKNKNTHHVLSCPRCRRAVKVPLKQMKRSLPRNYELPNVETPAPAETSDVAEATGTTDT